MTRPGRRRHLTGLPVPPQYRVPAYPPVTRLVGTIGDRYATLVLSGEAVRVMAELATFADLARTLSMGLGGAPPTAMWAEPVAP